MPSVNNSQNHNQNQNQSNKKNLMDDLDFFSTPSSSGPTKIISKELVLTVDKGNGMQISGSFSRRENQSYLDLDISNQTGSPMNDFAIQFNRNSFGIAPSQPQIQVILPGQTIETSLVLGTHNMMLNPPNSPFNNIVQICIKNNSGKFYFQMNVPLVSVLVENGVLSRDEYLSSWKNIPDEHSRDVITSTVDIDSILKRLSTNNIFYIARRSIPQPPQDLLYFSTKLLNDVQILLELTVSPMGCKMCSRSRQPELIPLFEQTVSSILS